MNNVQEINHCFYIRFEVLITVARKCLFFPIRLLENPGSVAYLPMLGSVSAQQVGPTFPPEALRLVENDLGVYNIPCEWIQVHMEQTSRLFDTRVKEHYKHIRLDHGDRSPVAEHSIHIVLTTKPRYVDSIIREATEVELHPNIMNSA
jgi:hypothetical protein